MGSNDLRKILSSESKWTDKTAFRHKHNFCISAIMKLEQPQNTYYFDVLKCDRCYSFVGVYREGGHDGFIGTFDKLSDEERNRPIIHLVKSHKTIGYKGAELKLK